MNKIILAALALAFGFFGYIPLVKAQTPKGQEPMVCSSGYSKEMAQAQGRGAFGPPVQTFKGPAATTFVAAMNRAYQELSGKEPKGEDLDVDMIEVYNTGEGVAIAGYLGGCTVGLAKIGMQQYQKIIQLKTAD